MVVSGDSGGNFILWALSDDSKVKQIKVPNPIKTVKFNKTGSMVAVGSKSVTILDLNK